MTDREAMLDDLFIRAIEKLDSIIALRNDLNRYMETGMIDLARARYATGGSRSSISSLSFDLGRMEATKRVSLESVPQQNVPKPFKDDPITRFCLETASNKADLTKSSINDNGRRNENAEGDPQLRKRQVASLNSDTSSDSLECSDPARSSLESASPTETVGLDCLNGNPARQSSISGYSSDRRQSNLSEITNENRTKQWRNDPLRWFGVLVPNSLRTSKECFDRALEVLTEVATQQNELAHLLDTFQQLHNETEGDNRKLNIESLIQSSLSSS